MTDAEALALQIAAAAVRLYAEGHPRPTHVNQVQAQQMLGCGKGKIASLVAAGVLPLNRCGLIPIECVDAARSAPTHRPHGRL